MVNRLNWKTKTRFYATAVLMLVLMVAAVACTPEPARETVAGTEVVVEEDSIEGEEVVVENADLANESLAVGVVNAHDNTIRATRLLDYNFRNANGDVTGEIQNILIDISTGQILFVTIKYGGFLDLGDTHLAMPLSAFSWGAENELVLNIQEERLENFPSLDENWPDLTNNLWDDEINQFWLDEGINPGIELSDDTSQVMYISELLDDYVGDIGFNRGDIEDVLINMSQSQGRYVIVDYGDDLFGDNLVAVPFSAFHGRMIDDELHFNENIDQELLTQAPNLARTGFGEADLFEQDFDRNLVDFWSDKGYHVGYEAGS